MTARPRTNSGETTALLPTNRQEMLARGWDRLDVLLVTGDAYIDHPSFGVPLLGRLLEARGYRVGIIAQPGWEEPTDIERMGAPALFCGISAGAMDSMVAHYTSFRKKRRDDAYTPGGRAGARPNRAVIVYTNLARKAFPGVPVVIGGIEASLRRAAHYDFWTDSIRRSILLDSKADLLVYGMAERIVPALADELRRTGVLPTALPGTATIAAEAGDCGLLPSWEAIKANPKLLVQATMEIESQVHRSSRALVQPHGSRFVRLNPPAAPLSPEQLDAVYDLPFTRNAHPAYTEPIPALDMVRWSVTAVRGCGGGCSFCSLALHQGRRLRSRSRESILREIARMTEHPDWRGTVSDVGGPTANLWGGRCRANPDRCKRPSCLWPARCPHLDVPQEDYLELLREIRSREGVKHVRVASGVRHDLALECPEFVTGLVREFVGGQLKLAPEHSVAHVLGAMRKSDFSLFERFLKLFVTETDSAGGPQYVVPYVMSAFPGCTTADMKALRAWFQRRGWQPRQVQCFIPTPGTVATAMYCAECDTDGNPIHVAKTDREREDQHAVLTGTKGIPKSDGDKRPPRRDAGRKAPRRPRRS